MDDQILSCLQSLRSMDIVDGLYEFYGEKIPEKRPKGKILELILQHLSHRDAYVREVAVLVIGTHWREEEAWPILVEMLSEKERDQSILMGVIEALGEMVFFSDEDTKSERLKVVSPLFSKVIFNQYLDPELRGDAYTNLLKMHSKINTREYARMSKDIEELTVDFDWLESLSDKK